MLTRVIVGVLGIPLLLFVLLVLPPVCLPVILAALCCIAAHECMYATGEVRHKGLVGLSMAMAILVPFWYYFGLDHLAGFAGVFAFFLGMSILAISSHQTIKFGQMGIALFAGLLIPGMLSVFVLLSDLEHGKLFILLPFVSAFSSDAFALFAGMAFGKHKLAPKLSPKKTIEGSVGGFLASAVMCALYGVIVGRFWGHSANYPALVIYGMLASIVSQLGDLSFSYIKREAGIKDYGRFLPGHGGGLDRFDSVIFCAPFTYIVVMLLPLFRF